MNTGIGDSRRGASFYRGAINMGMNNFSWVVSAIIRQSCKWEHFRSDKTLNNNNFLKRVN